MIPYKILTWQTPSDHDKCRWIEFHNPLGYFMTPNHDIPEI